MADLGTDHTHNSFHCIDGIHFPISDYWLTIQLATQKIAMYYIIRKEGNFSVH